MMARQIIEENLKIGLPEYKGSVGKFVDDVGEYIDVPFTIAEKQTVSLTKDSGSTMLKVRYQATLNTTGRWRNMS